LKFIGNAHQFVAGLFAVLNREIAVPEVVVAAGEPQENLQSPPDAGAVRWSLSVSDHSAVIAQGASTGRGCAAWQDKDEIEER